MGLNRQGVQRIVNEMAAEGLTAFADNPHHRRARLVVLTERGRSAYDGAVARQKPWAEDLAEGLGAGDLDAAAALLRMLRSRLEQGTDRE